MLAFLYCFIFCNKFKNKGYLKHLQIYNFYEIKYKAINNTKIPQIDHISHIECTKDTTGALESILYNDNVQGNSYVTINEGEYFKLQGGEMYPIAEALSIIPEDGLYKDGMYKVGQDIPAGEYKVKLTSAVGMGYLEVSTDSRHQLVSIVTNENVTADSYITVAEGQYLKIQGVEIQK